jgi:murein L,D-transpeptidase YcbB/YkuD
VEFLHHSRRRAVLGLTTIVLAMIATLTIGAASCAEKNRALVVTAVDRAVTDDARQKIFTQRLCGARAAAACSARANDVWTDMRAFYRQREGEPVWVNGRKPSKAANVALFAFARAAEHGLDAEKYGAAFLKSESARLGDLSAASESAAEELANFETDLTAGLLALGRDVAIGRPGPPPAGVGDRKRTAPDIGARLAAVIDEGDFTAWPDDVRPVHPQYALLQAALAKMIVAAPESAPARTTAPARPPAPDQVRTLALNLERWRWMPDDFGARYVLVNVPSFHLWVYEGQRPVIDSKVIVGKLGDETPLFSAGMTNIIFSPYWNIPESIAEGETVPSIVKNPAYLAKNNIEVLRRTGDTVTRVDPASVDWSDASETSEISLRQKPGPGNALGNIKFLLPNRHNVYLHDTPTHNLFAKDGRALSHGCVRVHEPVELAQYLLADDPKWTEESIRTAMNSGDEQSVKLKAPMPVHIVYFTAWPGADGTVEFLKDVYSRDR